MKALLPLLLCVAGCSLDTGYNGSEPRPDGAVDVVMQFCDQPPAWFAYKNEGQDWVLRQVSSGQREFTFPATDRVSVVTGFGFASLSFSVSDVVVRNLTAAEANAFRCRLTPLGVSQMTGLVQTESSQDLTIVQFGDAVDFTTGNQSFVMSRLGPGTLDLVALNRLFDTATARVIVRSGITVSNSAAFPMLDFAGPEARTLGTVKIRHDGGNSGAGFVQFETSRKSRIAIPGGTTAFSDGDTLRLHVIPAAFVGAGDLHRFDIQSGDRGVTYWQPVPKDTSVTFGPNIGALTVDTLFTTPVLRPRARFASQSEYAAIAEVQFLQTSSTTSRSIKVITTASFLGGTPAQWELSLPDLRGVIPDPWILRAGQPTTTRVLVRDARPALYHGIDTPTPGETMRYAAKTGQ